MCCQWSPFMGREQKPGKGCSAVAAHFQEHLCPGLTPSQ